MTRHQGSTASASPTLLEEPRAAGGAPANSFINISPVERWGRVAIGIAGIAVAIVLLTSAGSAVAVVLELLLLAAGLDMLITGARGHCPLYARLGRVPRSRQVPR